MAVNTPKILVGGLAAGVVILVLDFVTNLLVLEDRFQAEMEALNPTLAANLASTGTLVGFVVLDIVFGVLLTWLYAAIRPRLGPGPKTAAIAGVYFWLLTGMVWASLVVTGLFSWGLYVLSGVMWLITSLVAAQVAGWIYTEEAATASP